MSSAKSIRDSAASLVAAYHVKGELVRDGAMLHGWCWSPARPQERLLVELVRDDEKIGTALAARLRLDLAREEVCDGYHGFSFQMPAAPFARLEVREVATRQAFGRILGERAGQPADWDSRTGSVTEDLARADRVLHRLCQRRDRAVDTSRLFPAGLCLPSIAAPALTLVLDVAASVPAALAAVQQLVPVLADHEAELLVVDAGRDRLSAALASIPGLGYIQLHPGNMATRFNAAISRARGARLMLIGTTDNVASDVVSWLARPPAAQEIMVSAAILPMTDPTLASAGLPAGAPVLFAAREVFAAVGGFDPACDDGGDLVLIEFALRARAKGHTLISLQAGAGIRRAAGHAPAAREYFRDIIGHAADV